ncbi:hypothetical protein [Dysgonomonas sp. Marseille-P4361]|uniref:hypothetical protein n=1 Tax=Dysgonomonas sp. Marseille-P4361 TaxID=2161820 RepID=UPI000D55D7F4|nr:hypothetical protein [Dysgonomonas sp. Marseille-P4361]
MQTKLLYVLLLSLVFCSIQAQDLNKIAEEIEAEGKSLFRLELAAWYGSEIFRENYNGERTIGGYFSYIDADTPKCLFFSKDEKPKVIGVVSFGDIKIVETATIDFKVRDFKKEEKALYTIRQKALEEVRQDTLFKNYTNSSLNLIPVIEKDIRRVYALTAPKVSGVVLFGNDYLLEFNKEEELVNVREIHKSLIPVDFGEEGDSITFHNHASEIEPFITPSDICTLLLYAKFAGWKRHFVASKEYVSIWDCEKESLRIVTREQFDNMKDEEL